jgi:hypothetical protein
MKQQLGTPRQRCDPFWAECSGINRLKGKQGHQMVKGSRPGLSYRHWRGRQRSGPSRNDQIQRQHVVAG